MSLIKTSTGYRFESTGREIDEKSLIAYSDFHFTSTLKFDDSPSERKELAEYMIQRWAEWGGVDIRRIA